MPGVRTDARRERDPVAALDGRDRVELHAGEPADRRLDLGRRARPGARRIALGLDRDPAQGGEGDGSHRGILANGASGAQAAGEAPHGTPRPCRREVTRRRYPGACSGGGATLEDRGEPGGVDVAARDDAHDPALARASRERRRDG